MQEYHTVIPSVVIFMCYIVCMIWILLYILQALNTYGVGFLPDKFNYMEWTAHSAPKVSNN